MKYFQLEILPLCLNNNFVVQRNESKHNLHCVSSPLTVTLIAITIDAGLLSCNCMAGGSGKLCSSLSHESFIGALGIT